MVKADILKKLKQSNLDKDEIIVLSGASLVVQGKIESTKDIDIACSQEYYNKLNWKTKIGAFGIEIKYNDIFEISYNLFFPNEITIIEGYKFLNVEKCIEIKEQLNRKKDKRIIEKYKK